MVKFGAVIGKEDGGEDEDDEIVMVIHHNNQINDISKRIGIKRIGVKVNSAAKLKLMARVEENQAVPLLEPATMEVGILLLKAERSIGELLCNVMKVEVHQKGLVGQ
ncbi:unnamed protein product [Dovyalis caffra]|uniref:Uncharacterized protein n=1 Tax=Dovyalis caffra TaxID=77055 RepID=A0AAV1RZ41_9ROSI|nr:unnamed protein product [Dovyalis caffra]